MPEEQEQFTQESETTENQDVVGEQNETTELETPPEPTEDELKQKKINDRFAEVTNQRLQAEDEARKLKEENERQAEELAKFKQADEQIIVPELPTLPEYPEESDQAEYNRKILEREDAIRKKAIYDDRKNTQAQAQQQTLQDKQAEANRQYAESVNAYWKKVSDSGMDEDSMKAYGQAVERYIDPVIISDFILPHDKGPQIAEYYGKNPIEADKLRGMNPFQAVSFIESNVVPNLNTTKKQKPSPERQLSSDAPTSGGSGQKGGRFY